MPSHVKFPRFHFSRTHDDAPLTEREMKSATVKDVDEQRGARGNADLCRQGGVHNSPWSRNCGLAAERVRETNKRPIIEGVERRLLLTTAGLASRTRRANVVVAVRLQTYGGGRCGKSGAMEGRWRRCHLIPIGRCRIAEYGARVRLTIARVRSAAGCSNCGSHRLCRLTCGHWGVGSAACTPDS